MAQTEFILNFSVQNELFDLLLKKRLFFVPDLNYEKPECTFLDKIGDINKVIESNKLAGPFFLPRMTEAENAFKFSHILKNGKDVYYILPRMGLPRLDLVACELKKKYAPPLLKSGYIAYYPSYFIDNKHVEVKVPEWIKTSYKEVNAFLRKKCKKIKVKKRWY